MGKGRYRGLIGRGEAEEKTVGRRTRGAGKKQEILAVDAFIERLLGEIATRALPVVPDAVPAADAKVDAEATA